jgi:hypothetical protein
MKKTIVIVFVLFCGFVWAQTDGLSYQAVIINPDAQELPGLNSSSNILPNRSLQVRFTILDAVGAIEYQEIQQTSTDAFGMINLIIGQGIPSIGVFTDIDWDGNSKDLAVAVNLGGSFTELSYQPLLFVPYSFHRDIRATGRLVVEGSAFIGGDLEVAGTMNLNNSLSVNNNVPTTLTGTLTVDGGTVLNNSLSVTNGSATSLSGTLTVDGATTLNDALSVTNGSATNLSGTLTVDGATDLNNTLTVDGVTTLNDALSVANGSASNLSGTLTVDGATDLNNTLTVDGVTTLNDALSVTNGSATNLSGTLTVDGATDLNNTLTVDGVTTLNDALSVANGSTTNLSGALTVDGTTDLNNTLTVDGVTTLNDALSVANGSATNLSGTLTVDGATDLNNTLTVSGVTTLNNDLMVTGTATLETLNLSALNVTNDASGFLATLNNTNGGNGDGLLIKLGRNHGAWNNGSYLNLPNPGTLIFESEINTVRGWLNGSSSSTVETIIGIADLTTLVPVTLIAGGTVQITNSVIGSINSGLGLPIGTPEIAIPELEVFPGLTIFPGFDLSPLPGSIPSVTIPRIVLPRTPILPAIPQLIPRIPEIPQGNLPEITIPNFTFSVVNNSLTSANEFVDFQDKDGRSLGAIRAQSTQDFRDNTVLDDIYLVNFTSKFIKIDLLGAVVEGVTEVTNLIDRFNNLGVEYASGHGDYAEWLEREDPNEYLTAGDIVAVKGGKVTKDLTNMEQIMVVSHKPIVLGNVPSDDTKHLGNTIAFMGQVPVKVMDAVHTGDYIVAHPSIKGYGVAKSASSMSAKDYKYAVGRAWETNANKGPKVVNTVVGVHNGDWVALVDKLIIKQNNLDKTLDTIEATLQKVASQKKVNVLTKVKIDATK